MNKEFIGKKKFYLEDYPEKFVIVRLYVVESRQNEYMTAVLDNDDAFQIETFEGPDGSMIKCFVDFENRRFLEYPTLTAKNIRFLDRREYEIGVGEVSMMRIGSASYYMAGFTTGRSFKYKKNGWDFSVDRGEEFVIPMTKTKRESTVLPFIATIGRINNKVNLECLENKHYQISCLFPEQLR